MSRPGILQHPCMAPLPQATGSFPHIETDVDHLAEKARAIFAREPPCLATVSLPWNVSGDLRQMNFRKHASHASARGRLNGIYRCADNVRIFVDSFQLLVR